MQVVLAQDLFKNVRDLPHVKNVRDFLIYFSYGMIIKTTCFSYVFSIFPMSGMILQGFLSKLASGNDIASSRTRKSPCVFYR